MKTLGLLSITLLFMLSVVNNCNVVEASSSAETQWSMVNKYKQKAARLTKDIEFHQEIIRNFQDKSQETENTMRQHCIEIIQAAQKLKKKYLEMADWFELSEYMKK